jgi:hypothetical protein
MLIAFLAAFARNVISMTGTACWNLQVCRGPIQVIIVVYLGLNNVLLFDPVTLSYLLRIQRTL